MGRHLRSLKNSTYLDIVRKRLSPKQAREIARKYHRAIYEGTPADVERFSPDEHEKIRNA